MTKRRRSSLVGKRLALGTAVRTVQEWDCGVKHEGGYQWRQIEKGLVEVVVVIELMRTEGKVRVATARLLLRVDWRVGMLVP